MQFVVAGPKFEVAGRRLHTPWTNLYYSRYKSGVTILSLVVAVTRLLPMDGGTAVVLKPNKLGISPKVWTRGFKENIVAKM